MNYATLPAITVGVVTLGWYVSYMLPYLKNAKAEPKKHLAQKQVSPQTSIETLFEQEDDHSQQDIGPIASTDQESDQESKLENNAESVNDQQDPSLKITDNFSSKGTELTGSFIILNREDSDNGSLHSQEPHKLSEIQMETIPVKTEEVERDEFFGLTEAEQRKLSDIRTSKLEKMELERKMRMLQLKWEETQQVAQREALCFEKLRNVPEQMNRK
jgi:hypothetical protein